MQSGNDVLILLADHSPFILVCADIQPSFIAAVSPSSKKVDSSWLEDIPEAVPHPVRGFSVTGAIANRFGKDSRKEAPPTSSATGVSQEDELRSSFSPHRTLTQTDSPESHGTGEQAGLVETSSGSSPHSSSLTVPHNEMLHRMIQQGAVGGAVGGAEGDDEVVVQQSKTKGKAKKKKKRKKPKIPDADNAGTPQSIAVTPPSIATTTQSVAVTATDVTTAAGDQSEADGAQIKDVDSSPQPSRVKKGEGEEGEEGRVNSPEEQEMPWEHWANDGSGVTSEGAAEPTLGEDMEECDFGSRVHPLPVHPPAASNKRLSLADELELAMERDPSPQAGRSCHDDILERSTEATPSDHTPGNTDPHPTLDPTPSNTEDRPPVEAAQQGNPVDDTPPSDTPPLNTSTGNLSLLFVCLFVCLLYWTASLIKTSLNL